MDSSLALNLAFPCGLRGFHVYKQRWNPRLKGRLHDRAKMARARQKLEQFQQFLQRNSELVSVPRRVHRRLWARAIFALSCKRPLNEKLDTIICFVKLYNVV